MSDKALHALYGCNRNREDFVSADGDEDSTQWCHHGVRIVSSRTYGAYLRKYPNIKCLNCVKTFSPAEKSLPVDETSRHWPQGHGDKTQLGLWDKEAKNTDISVDSHSESFDKFEIESPTNQAHASATDNVKLSKEFLHKQKHLPGESRVHEKKRDGVGHLRYDKTPLPKDKHFIWPTSTP